MVLIDITPPSRFNARVISNIGQEKGVTLQFNRSDREMSDRFIITVGLQVEEIRVTGTD